MKEILTVDEACVYMGLSKSLLYKLCSQRRITFYKNGRLYFKKSDLEAYMLKNEHKSIDASEEMLNDKLGGKNGAGEV